MSCSRARNLSKKRGLPPPTSDNRQVADSRIRYARNGSVSLEAAAAMAAAIPGGQFRGAEVAFEDLGPHHLKGVPEDASIYVAMNPH